jgi:hypothetical protein
VWRFRWLLDICVVDAMTTTHHARGTRFFLLGRVHIRSRTCVDQHADMEMVSRSGVLAKALSWADQQQSITDTVCKYMYDEIVWTTSSDAADYIYTCNPADKEAKEVFCTTITVARDTVVTVESSAYPLSKNKYAVGTYLLPLPDVWYSPMAGGVRVTATEECTIKTCCIPLMREKKNRRVKEDVAYRPVLETKLSVLPPAGGRVHMGRLYLTTVNVRAATLVRARLLFAPTLSMGMFRMNVDRTIMVGEQKASASGEVSFVLAAPICRPDIDHIMIEADHADGMDPEEINVEAVCLNFMMWTPEWGNVSPMYST